jgi:chromosome partitioning protein
MHRIAIAAAKGGTGKTTTAVSLAHALALAGRRVLLVDCDPKRHAALHFGLPLDGGLAALLRGGGALAVEVRRGLRIVDSGGPALAAVEMQLAREAGGTERLPALVEARFRADYLLFDCPPWLGPMHLGALQASDGVLLPVGADYLSLMSARQTLDVIRELPGPDRSRPRLLGLLPTFYDAAAPSAQQVESVLQESYAQQVLQTRIHLSEALRSAPAARGTVFESDPLSRGALDYALLAEEIEALVG